MGAWLHIWTPPRDVEVPPVPWRKLLLVGVPILLALVPVGWYMLDEGAETRRSNEAAEARAKAEQAAARREELLAEQAAHRARVEPAERGALVSALETHVLRDVRSRDLEYSVERVECEPHPRTVVRRRVELDPSRKSGRYYCLAVTRDIVGVGEGSIGYPFLGRIVYDSGELVWCKITPVPGEQIIADPRTIVELPKACGG